MRPAHFNIVWLLLLTLVSCSGREKPKNFERVVPVLVETVKKETVPLFVETIGNVNSLCIVEIQPQVRGRLIKCHVEPGQIVEEGDLLFTIDPRHYQAVYDKVQANLVKDQAAYDFAKKRVERFSDLVKKEFVSKLSFDEYQREMETAKAQVLKDRAELALAKIDLEHCQITAPMEGRISNLPIDPGNLVFPNSQIALTELRQISPICVDFNLPQKDLQHMQRNKSPKDLKIEVILPHEKGDEDDSYIGHLTFVDNHIDQRNGTILLKGIVDNEEHLLWPGEFVQIRMRLTEKKDALLVPESSVQNGQQGPFLYVVNEEMRVEARPVILGEKVGENYIIEKGIEEGEQVVTTGQLNLTPGKKVAIKS